MASSIPTLAALMVKQLKIGSGRSEPTTDDIGDYLRLAFRDCIADFNPVKSQQIEIDQSSATIPTYSATLIEAALRVWYVSVGTRLLQPVEFIFDGEVIHLIPSVGADGSEVTVWFTPSIDIELGSTDSVDTSCIFGPNWLEQPAYLKAQQSIHDERSHRATSGGGQQHQSRYRVKAETITATLAKKAQDFMRWDEEMKMRQQQRFSLGDQPLLEHPMASVINLSEFITLGRER